MNLNKEVEELPPFIEEIDEPYNIEKYQFQDIKQHWVYVLLIEMNGLNWVYLTHKTEPEINNLTISMISKNKEISNSLLLGDLLEDEVTVQFCERLVKRYSVPFYLSLDLKKDEQGNGLRHDIEIGLIRFLDKKFKK